MRKALLEGDANHGHVMYAVIGQVHESALHGGILCAGQGQPRKVGAEYQGPVAGNVAELRSRSGCRVASMTVLINDPDADHKPYALD